MRYLLILTILFLPGKAISQRFSIGMRSQVSYNKLMTDISTLPLTKLSGGVGYGIGATLAYSINKNFKLYLNESFLSRNYSMQRTDTLTGLEDNYKNGYLIVEFSPKLTVPIRKINLLIGVGVFSGYWIQKGVIGSSVNLFNSQSSSITQSFYSSQYSQSVKFDKRKDNRFEFGWSISGGVEYQFDRISISTELLILYSLTDQQKKYMLNQTPRYNQTFALGISFLFDI
jgi:hypothetical protein